MIVVFMAEKLKCYLLSWYGYQMKKEERVQFVELNMFNYKTRQTKKHLDVNAALGKKVGMKQ